MEGILRLYRSPYVDRLPEPERTERYQSLAVLMAQFDYQFNRAAKEEEWRASGAVHEWAQRKEQPDDDYDDDYGEYSILLLLLLLELDT